jgi:hypothetical protein
MLQKIDTCQPSDASSYTNAYQKHNPINFVYYVKYSNGEFKPPVNFGTDAARVFYKKIKGDVLYIAKNYYDKIFPLKLLNDREKLISNKYCMSHLRRTI